MKKDSFRAGGDRMGQEGHYGVGGDRTQEGDSFRRGQFGMGGDMGGTLWGQMGEEGDNLGWEGTLCGGRGHYGVRGDSWGQEGHDGVGGDRGRERLEAIGDPWQLFRVIRSHLGPLGATGGHLEPFGVNLGLFGVY